MEFETKELYENIINNSYIDYKPEAEFSGYTRPDRHYIYPKYEAFEKEYSEIKDITPFTNDLFTRMIGAAVIAQIEEKPVELLNAEEKLGIFIGAGIPMKYENGKMITLYDVGIVVIDGKYKVLYHTPKMINTY